MPSSRKRSALTAGIASFVPARIAARLPPEAADGEGLARLARTLLELAAAHRGAALIFDRRNSLSGLLRNSRDLGLDPRVAAPTGRPGMSARPALTYPLQGPASGAPFQAAALALADLVADASKTSRGTADADLRARVSGSVTKAAERSTAGLAVPQIAAMLAASLPAAHPLRGKALDALQMVADAERAAAAFSTPVSWAALLSPSPSGRSAAVLFQLSGLPEAQADLIEELALASLAAQESEIQFVLGGGPLSILASVPRGPLGRWAVARLAGSGEGEPLVAMCLLLPRYAADAKAAASPFGDASISGDSLDLPGLAASLPLAPAFAAPPLSDDEVRNLTPDTLVERLLGARAGDDEDAELMAAPETVPQGAPKSVQALREASADLKEIARKRAPGAHAPPSRKKGDYEAGDFDLK